jgi:hypothetical protein
VLADTDIIGDFFDQSFNGLPGVKLEVVPLTKGQIDSALPRSCYDKVECRFEMAIPEDACPLPWWSVGAFVQLPAASFVGWSRCFFFCDKEISPSETQGCRSTAFLTGVLDVSNRHSF